MVASLVSSRRRLSSLSFPETTRAENTICGDSITELVGVAALITVVGGDFYLPSIRGAGRVNAYSGQKMPAGIFHNSAAQFKSNVLNDAFNEIKELAVPCLRSETLRFVRVDSDFSSRRVRARLPEVAEKSHGATTVWTTVWKSTGIVWHSPGVPSSRGFRVLGWRCPRLCPAGSAKNLWV